MSGSWSKAVAQGPHDPSKAPRRLESFYGAAAERSTADRVWYQPVADVAQIIALYTHRYRPHQRPNWAAWVGDQQRRIETQTPRFVLPELGVAEVLKIAGALAEDSFEEICTASFWADMGLSLGWPLRAESGQKPNQTHLLFAPPGQIQLALRADLDGVGGHAAVHHSCGHDLSMTASFLAYQKLLERGQTASLALLFQPAEEGSRGRYYAHPKGYAGGQVMAELGVYALMDQVLSIHVDPDLPAGTARIRAGEATAGAHEFSARLEAPSRHAAFADGPPTARDKLSALEKDIDALNQRYRDSDRHCWVCVTRYESAPCPSNTTPAWIEVSGITRYLGSQALSDIEELASKHGLELLDEAPPTENDPQMAEVCTEVALSLGLKVDHAPATFRDMAAHVSGRALHVYLASHERCGPLHSDDFVGRPQDAIAQAELLVATALKLLDV